MAPQDFPRDRENRSQVAIHRSLPPSLRALELRFPYPRGIFESAERSHAQSLRLPREAQSAVCEFIGELAKGLSERGLGIRQVRLVEVLEIQLGGMYVSFDMLALKRAETTRYVLPEEVLEVCRRAGVEVDVELLGVRRGV